MIRRYRRLASAYLVYGSFLRLLWPPAALPSRGAPIDGEVQSALSCNGNGSTARTPSPAVGG
jgi:hypothetical protein